MCGHGRGTGIGRGSAGPDMSRGPVVPGTRGYRCAWSRYTAIHRLLKYCPAAVSPALRASATQLAAVTAQPARTSRTQWLPVPTTTVAVAAAYSHPANRGPRAAVVAWRTRATHN